MVESRQAELLVCEMPIRGGGHQTMTPTARTATGPTRGSRRTGEGEAGVDAAPLRLAAGRLQEGGAAGAEGLLLHHKVQ